MIEVSDVFQSVVLGCVVPVVCGLAGFVIGIWHTRRKYHIPKGDCAIMYREA